MEDPGLVRGRDIANTDEAERFTRGVFKVIKANVTWGEVEDVIRQFPEEIRELWS